MNIYNNKIYEWIKNNQIRDATRIASDLGMQITDADRYNKVIESRAKSGFWILSSLVIVIIFFFFRMIQLW